MAYLMAMIAIAKGRISSQTHTGTEAKAVMAEA